MLPRPALPLARRVALLHAARDRIISPKLPARLRYFLQIRPASTAAFLPKDGSVVREHVVRCLIGGSLWALGDLLAQSFAEPALAEPSSTGADPSVLSSTGCKDTSNAVLDEDESQSSGSSPLGRFTSTKNSFLLGGFLFTPLANCWYQFADKLVPGRLPFPCSPAFAPLVKTALDQTLWCVCVLTMIYGGFALLEGKTLTHASERACSEVPTTIVPNWCVWVPTQFLNFYLVPAGLRIYVVNVVTVPWTGYLAWRNRRAGAVV